MRGQIASESIEQELKRLRTENQQMRDLLERLYRVTIIRRLRAEIVLVLRRR
jgi:hypothetical protein